MYRKYHNFSQTDIASSTWEEIAYVSKIETPTQQLIVESVMRTEIDFDYYEKIANVKYQDHAQVSEGTMSPSFFNSLTIKFPNREEKYRTFDLFDKITGNRINKHKLEYASPGSPQELCASAYYIREVNAPNYHDLETPYINRANAYHLSKRGKTTLTGIKMFSDNTSSSVDYSFEYGYNPDYTPVHRAMMWKQLYSPLKRESIGFPSTLNNP